VPGKCLLNLVSVTSWCLWGSSYKPFSDNSGWLFYLKNGPRTITIPYGRLAPGMAGYADQIADTRVGRLG